jgi:predicted RNA-binding protein (virulence factor B family)
MVPSRSILPLIGSTHEFKVERKTPAGWLLSRDDAELLLPTGQATIPPSIGEQVSAFVYTDSEDRPIATLRKPAAQVGEFAYLKVVDQNAHGCFLDWGLDKDLFCPRSEQHQPMQAGCSYVVAVYLDNHTSRVAAAGRLAQFLDYDLSPVEPDQQVSLLVFGLNPRGAQVICDDRYSGLIYLDQNFKKFAIGDRLTGFVDQCRADNKLDIRLRKDRPQGTLAKLSDARAVVLAALKESAGELALGDKSKAEDIYERLEISKKAFKSAVGQLYKQGLVQPGEHSLRLVSPEQNKKT